MSQHPSEHWRPQGQGQAPPNLGLQLVPEIHEQNLKDQNCWRTFPKQAHQGQGQTPPNLVSLLVACL